MPLGFQLDPTGIAQGAGALAGLGATFYGARRQRRADEEARRRRAEAAAYVSPEEQSYESALRAEAERGLSGAVDPRFAAQAAREEQISAADMAAQDEAARREIGYSLERRGRAGGSGEAALLALYGAQRARARDALRFQREGRALESVERGRATGAALYGDLAQRAAARGAERRAIMVGEPVDTSGREAMAGGGALLQAAIADFLGRQRAAGAR